MANRRRSWYGLLYGRRAAACLALVLAIPSSCVVRGPRAARVRVAASRSRMEVEEDDMRRRTFTLAFLLVVALCVALIAPSLAARIGHAAQLAAPPLNVDVSQRATNESEETVAVNPTNPRNIVIVTNVVFPDAGLFEGVSFDGGATWATKIIADNDNLGAACCDPSLSFDSFGNLFLTYLFNVGNVLPIAIITDGGLNFASLASIAKPPKSSSQNAGDARRAVRFVDQPTITSGHGEAWGMVNGGWQRVS